MKAFPEYEATLFLILRKSDVSNGRTGKRVRRYRVRKRKYRKYVFLCIQIYFITK